MILTGAEITALRSGLRKAATALGHTALTGPGSGAGSVDKPLRPSKVPGRNRTKKTIETADAQRFARKIVQRVSGQRFPIPGRARTRRIDISAPDVDRLVEGVGVLMSALPGGRIDMAAILEAHGEPQTLADRMREAMPQAAEVVGEAWVSVLDELAGIVCEHVVEFFTSRESFPAAVDLELLKQSARKFQVEDEAALIADYTQLVRAKSEKIRLFGLDLHEDDQSYDLMAGFVDLTVETEEAWRQNDMGVFGTPAERFSWVDFYDLVGARKRVLLEGPAGSGKSTLLQWLTLRRLAHGTLVVPFLIRLREFVSTETVDLPSPNQLLATLAKPLAGRLPGWELELFRQGGALLLVDGVDEIPEQLRDEALQWLEDLVRAYPRNRYVVTTRPAGMDERWREQFTRRWEFTKATVNPMSPNQVSTFIERWHDAASRRPGANPAELSEYADSLQQVIRSRRDLAQITTTPLLCAMVCALYRADNRVLPRNRTALYERAYTMLLEKRDTHQKIQPLPVSLSRDQIEPFLTEIALWMMLNKQRSIPHQDALDLVRAELPRLQLPDAPPKFKLTADKLLRHLVVRSGVLQEPTMDLLEFVHPSFQDFLAAKGVFRKKYLAHLIDNAHDPMYQDVAVMAVSQAQNDPDRQDELLERLIERAKTNRTQARQLYLLAAACVADAGMVDPKWVKLTRSKTRSMLPPRTSREAAALASAGEFTLDLLADIARKHPFTMAEAEATIDAIAQMRGGGEVGFRILRTLAEDFGRLIGHELIGAWHQAEDPQAFLDGVLAFGDVTDYWVYIRSPELVPLSAQIPGLSLLQLPGTKAPPPELRGLTGLGGGFPLGELSGYPLLRWLDLRAESAADLRGIDRFSRLTNLNLTSDADLDLRPLAGLPALRSLWIEGATAPDLAPLATLGTLRYLTVRSGSSRTIDLTPLAEMRQLNTLNLGASSVMTRAPLRHVTDLQVAFLTEESGHLAPRMSSLHTSLEVLEADLLTDMTGLTTFTARGEVGARDVTPLAALPRLTTLDLIMASDDPVGLPALDIAELRLGDHHAGLYSDLAQIPSLKQLNVNHASGRTLAKLPPLPTLNKVVVWNVDELNLAKLADIAEITELEISMGNKVDLRPLAAFPALTTLEISNTHAIDIEPLTRLTGLEELEIYSVNHFDRSLLRGLTGLKRLLLDGRSQLDPTWLPEDAKLTLYDITTWAPSELAALPTLRSLDLGDIPDCGLAALAAVPRLEHLRLTGTAGVRVEDLAAWPALTDLSLDGVPGIDFDALTALPQLRTLRLYRMPYSGIGVLPNIEVLRLENTEVDLSELTALPRLRHLILDTLPEPDLSLLAALPSLKKLELIRMPWADLAPFKARPDIELILR